MSEIRRESALRRDCPFHAPACVLIVVALGFGCNWVRQANVPFIMVDDKTTQSIGAFGSRLAVLTPTPNIDALAKGGMRFDQVFCNNSICTPSRASIITRHDSQANGVLDLAGNIPPERQYRPVEMGKAGYHTAMIGTWLVKDREFVDATIEKMKEDPRFDLFCQN